MSEVRYYTSLGNNYRGGVYNDNGSQMVGWDNRLVRAEVYAFRTGDWPITHIRWWGPTTSLYQGSNISIRYIISTSETAYVNASGQVAGSYEMIKNADNNLDVYLAPNTTYYFTFFPGISRDAGWGLLKIGDEGPGNYFSVWSTELSYTPVTAPTSIWLDRSIQIPGQAATLSWSGATGGINTTISGYNVYRATSASGSYSYIGTTTSTFINVTAPSAGNYYYYKVVTQCAQSTDYNADFSQASGGLKGNTAPGAPSVSVNKTVVPSTGGAVVFTVTAGSDPDGQTLSLYYSATSGGTKIKFTSPLSVNITNNSTYYFYTFDGLQYSSVTSKAVSVNTKPVISSVTYNAITTYSALGGNGTTGSQLGFASNITPKFSANKTGWVTVELEYYASNGTSAWNSSSVTRKTLQKTTQFTSTSNVVLSAHNIHQYISLGSTNLHWRLRLRIEDGVEYSDYVYYPSNGQYYTIARPSSLVASYNQFSDSNISGTIAGEIWRNVRLKIYNDTSVPSASATAKVNGSSVSATTSTSVNGTYRYIDITLADGIASGASINITATLKDSANSISKNISATVKETKYVSLGSLSHGASSIKPFTGTGTFAVSVGWPFGSYSAVDATTLAAYNCSTTASNAIKFIHSSSNSGSGANRVIKTPTWSKSSDSMTTSFDRSTIYDWNHTLGISTYAGTPTYYCRLEITNLFGKVISTPWLSRTFDFREKVQSPTISSIEWSLNGSSNWTTLGANDKIQQGVYLRFNTSFGLFTTDEVIVYISLTNSSGENNVTCYESGSSRTTPIVYRNTELTRATGRTAASNTKSYIYYVNTEIADTTTRRWRLRFETTGGTSYSGYVDRGVTRQCKPTVKFDSCEVDQDYNLTYAYTITDNGGADTLTNYLYDGTNEITAALSGSSGTIQAKSEYRSWEVKTISIKIVSQVTGLYTRTTNYYTNAIIVYQLFPTVAYRKNQLGINTNTPTSGAVVDVHQSTGKNLVLIQGYDTNLTPTKFEIDIATGQIKFYSNNTLKSTVDLLNGFLT